MEKKITLDHITKIEGHARLMLGIDHGEITRCELSATEGSRYFEGMVKGRKYYEAHEITSRICGICSCAHVIAAITAVENALDYVPSEQTKQLRVLMTLGERIRSHPTHLYFLALPDYLGYESALAMASKHKKELQTALRLIKTGNNIVRLLGARDLHPVSATVGGWLKLPKQEDIDMIKHELLEVKEDAIKTCSLFSSIKYPEFNSNGDWMSLSKKNAYAVLDGRLTTSNYRFDKDEYKDYLTERQVSYSDANFVSIKDKRYMVGALSRFNNNHDMLSRDARKMLRNSKIKLPSTNPYHNLIAQSVETVHCMDAAIEICNKLEIKDEKVDKMKVNRGRGVGAIEVPRGTLWHEYELDEKGMIKYANIITPTAQNLLNIQEDIRMFLPGMMGLKKEKLIMEIEKLIRTYDPCFSCSAHFLEVDWV